MDATFTSRMTVRRAVAAGRVAVGLALTGCQAAVNTHPNPAPAEEPPQARQASRPIDRPTVWPRSSSATMKA